MEKLLRVNFPRERWLPNLAIECELKSEATEFLRELLLEISTKLLSERRPDFLESIDEAPDSIDFFSV